jgi:hypothetical protein
MGAFVRHPPENAAVPSPVLPWTPEGVAWSLLNLAFIFD